MKVILKKEHTGLNNFLNCFDCPIARALKDAGFTSVLVSGHNTWSGIDKDGKEQVKIEIPIDISATALHEWSKVKQTEDVIFELPLPGEQSLNVQE